MFVWNLSDGVKVVVKTRTERNTTVCAKHHLKAAETSKRKDNANLMVALEEMAKGHQSQRETSSWNSDF